MLFISQIKEQHVPLQTLNLFLLLFKSGLLLGNTSKLRNSKNKKIHFNKCIQFSICELLMNIEQVK